MMDMFKTLLALIIITTMLMSGCAKNVSRISEYNLLIIIDRDFIKRKTTYDWWPKHADHVVEKASDKQSSGTVSIPGKDGLIVVAILLAVLIVVQAADVTAHNIKGTNVSLVIDGNNFHENYDLNWGINRFDISEQALQSLEKGTAELSVVAKGTRSLSLNIPIEGMKIKRDVHIIDFSNTGKILVDGMRL